MKTGRLLKFSRPTGEIHAYIYREGALFRASLYVMEPSRPSRSVAHTVEGASEELVERDVRAWVEAYRKPEP
jgi:hypothetical protein